MEDKLGKISEIFEESPIPAELDAMLQISNILSSFPKGQRDRICNWVIERVNSTAQRKNIEVKFRKVE